MKNLFLVFLMLVSCQIMAQAPQAFNYQGIARNASGDPLINTTVSLRITIKEGGTPGLEVYRELHHVTTNKLGLFALEIGRGTNSVGELSDVQWQSGAHYIQTEIDPTGGQSFTSLGTAQLLSVPYALYAGQSGAGGSSQWNDNGNGIDYSAGNVGIGTDVPGAKLSIEGLDDQGVDRNYISLRNNSISNRSLVYLSLSAGDNTSPTLLTHQAETYDIDNFSAANYGQLESRGNGIMLTASGINGNVRFLTSHDLSNNLPIERMRINEIGYVGIGTKVPDHRLSILDDVDDNEGRNLLSLNNTSTSNRSLAGIKINAGSGAFETRIEHVATSYDFDGDKYTGFGQFLSTGNGIILRASSNDGVIKFLAGNVNTTIAQERMRITGTGFIGIGTEDPASKLQVTGGDVFIENINTGVIMKSPDGICWRVTVQNDGSLKTTSISCPN